jgi:HEAT repeat protein
VNETGVTANMGIVMGKKCGIRDPEIDPAIERGSRFFSYYVGKGSIPYGEHMAYISHDNNGKCAMAAVYFALQGNRPEAAKFFAQMATAGYVNREYGHTGQGFSYLWGVLGANAGGPAAAAAFVKESRWHLDLVRRCDGSFTYDGAEQYGAGQTDDNTYWGRSSYNGLGPTACYVLSYAVPLRKLHITGKDAQHGDWLSRREVADAIGSGRFDLERKRMSAAELLEAFNDWSPVARSWAAEELASRPEAQTLEPRLIKLAEAGKPNVQEAACETLGNLKSTNALPVFVRALRSENRWLRVKAAVAIRQLGEAARPALPEILEALVETAEPSAPIVWADPIQIAQGQLAETVFRGLLKKSFDDTDRQLLYPAIRAVARNADGMARAQLRPGFANQLTEADVRALAPDLVVAVKELAPADLMFANEIRMGALQALVKYRFREAIPLCVTFVRTQSQHASQERTGEILKLLATYGVAAKAVLPELREFHEYCKTEPNFPDWARKQKAASVAEAIRVIEAAQEQPELNSLESKK